jgi:putative ABC transport system permease protein
MRLIQWFYTIPLRLRSLFRRRQVELELDEELRYHLERQIEELINNGMTKEEARYAALRALGGIEQRKEECRDMRSLRLIEELLQDLRYGLRTLRKSPGFTTVAVLTLAFGIGANTAIFSLVDPILIKSLPVKNPEGLVILKTVNQRGEDGIELSYPLFEQLRARTQVFSGVIATNSVRATEMIAEIGSPREKARLQLVSGEYFQVLGVNAIIGRTLTTADNQAPGAHPVAVLNYHYWQHRYRGDFSVVGKVITLKDQPLTIIGVTTPEFYGAQWGDVPDIWAPLMMVKTLNWRPSDLKDVNVMVMARLHQGVRVEHAQAAMNLFSGQIGEISKIVLFPGSQGFMSSRDWLSQPLRVLMAVVGLVLLIACANVANLLLARAARRAPEVAVRLTIGAGRFRLIRQFLTESLLLAGAGTVLGLLFAWWGCRVMLALLSEIDTPSDISISIGVGAISDFRVLGFTIAVSLFTTLLFGLAPALIATRQDLNAALKRPTPPRSRLSLSRTLVIAQVALSLLLLTGAGLFVQTLRNLRSRVVFAAEHIIHFPIDLRASGYKPEQLPDLTQRILNRLNTTPGVRSTSVESWWGTHRKTQACCIEVEGYNHRDDDRLVQTKGVKPGYFQTMGLPLLLGRDFSSPEVSAMPEKYAKVAIINETMARRYFGRANPLGKHFGWGDPRYWTGPQFVQRIDQGDPQQFEIVGVAKDTVYDGLREKTPPLIYFPNQDVDSFVVRAEGPGASLVATIRREIQAIDKNLEPDLQVSAQSLDNELFLERLLVKLSTFFALLALLLASIGLFGVMSYDVARRTHEIGIRMALGAQRRAVIFMVMRETMLLVVIGVIIGLSAALATTRLITSLLYGLKPNDPLTIALASMLLLTVAALAGYMPAHRAARADPISALRHD